MFGESKSKITLVGRVGGGKKGFEKRKRGGEGNTGSLKKKGEEEKQVFGCEKVKRKRGVKRRKKKECQGDKKKKKQSGVEGDLGGVYISTRKKVPKKS